MSIKTICLLAMMFILISCQQKEKSQSTEGVKEEARGFMAHYQELLRQSKFDEVATLYHSDGAILTVHGENQFKSLNTIKSEYTSDMGDSILYFQWGDSLLVDVVKDDVVIVGNTFLAKSNTFPDTVNMLYAAVLVKTDKGWKIKHENEAPDMNTYKKIARFIEGNKQ